MSTESCLHAFALARICLSDCGAQGWGSHRCVISDTSCFRPLSVGSALPALRKVREKRGTRSCDGVGEDQKPGPPVGNVGCP